MQLVKTLKNALKKSLRIYPVSACLFNRLKTKSISHAPCKHIIRLWVSLPVYDKYVYRTCIRETLGWDMSLEHVTIELLNLAMPQISSNAFPAKLQLSPFQNSSPSQVQSLFPNSSTSNSSQGTHLQSIPLCVGGWVGCNSAVWLYHIDQSHPWMILAGESERVCSCFLSSWKGSLLQTSKCHKSQSAHPPWDFWSLDRKVITTHSK